MISSVPKSHMAWWGHNEQHRSIQQPVQFGHVVQESFIIFTKESFKENQAQGMQDLLFLKKSMLKFISSVGY